MNDALSELERAMRLLRGSANDVWMQSRRMPSRWTVTFERTGERPISVEFAEEYDKNGDSAEYGYEDDFVLGSLIGMAIKAVTPGDEQPWRLAVVCNLLDYLGKFDASPEMVRLQEAAREVWESLSETKEDTDDS